MQGFDNKFALLLGDQYHSMAYYLITRTGNVELTKILTLIEESFWKIFYNLEKVSNDITENLKMLYDHFYNYLPQLFENSFKGLAVIFDLNDEGLAHFKAAGFELGFFFQFGIFSYILTAALQSSTKEIIKVQL